MESAKVLLGVQAGVVPGTAEPEYGRSWGITSKEWDESDDPMALLAERIGQAQGYAQLLALQPDRLNWVHLDWVWV
jgi:hypothetical protein